MEKTELLTGCLVEVNDNYEVDYSEPLEYDPLCLGFVYIETQLVKRTFNGDIRQTFLLELPKDSNDFYYSNVNTVSNLKYYIGNTYENRFYRISKGWIKGEFINNSWNIEFDLHYGGKKHNKYHIKNGANY